MKQEIKPSHKPTVSECHSAANSIMRNGHQILGASLTLRLAEGKYEEAAMLARGAWLALDDLHSFRKHTAKNSAIYAIMTSLSVIVDFAR